MKRVWIPAAGLMLIAVLAAFADSAMEPASATGEGTAAKLRNPAVKPVSPQASLLSKIGTGTKNLLARRSKAVYAEEDATAEPVQPGSHAAGSTIEGRRRSPNRPNKQRLAGTETRRSLAARREAFL